MSKNIKKILSKTLNSNSGASLVFVLALMVSLLLLGSSVLVASTVSTGTKSENTNFGKLELINDSVVNTFSKSLKGDLGQKISKVAANKVLELCLKNSQQTLNVVFPTTFEITSVSNTQLDEYLKQHSAKLYLTMWEYYPEIIGDTQLDTLGSTNNQVAIPSQLKMSLKLETTFSTGLGNQTSKTKTTYNCTGIIITGADGGGDDLYGTWEIENVEKVA